MLVEKENTNSQEIVIGLVAPLGANLERLADALERELSKHAYDSQVIRLSSLLKSSLDIVASRDNKQTSQSEGLMNAGDDLRNYFNSGDAVTALAIASMRNERSNNTFHGNQQRKVAWILRTLKHADEVELLRYVYGSRFILIGVTESEVQRTRNFEEILKTRDPSLQNIPSEAIKLIRRDEKDPTSKLGQQVRATNELADFYLDIGTNLIHDTKRIVSLLFGKPFETPTRDEQSMFHAFAASLRSSDSGRQVGAVIATRDGDIISVGTNEVPKPGGGQYWSGDRDDQRDFQVGRDYNKWQSRQMILEILGILDQNEFLSESLASITSEERLQRVFEGSKASSKSKNIPGNSVQSLANSRASYLIEFGRITHAEMSAITDAARHGKATLGSTIYVTAFPCHMCMRLIIASGITRVIYVDPYPKSLAVEMYGQLLDFSNSDSIDKVNIESFRGTSWRVFDRFFSVVNRDREDDGHFKSLKPVDRPFRVSIGESISTSMRREAEVVAKLGLLSADIANIGPQTLANHYLQEIGWLASVTTQASQEFGTL